jgi:catechol-2,3-dioxygenase
LAWKVGTINELARAHEALADKGVLTGASSHGATKSLYGKDPDGNEFEIVYTIPREKWGPWENSGTVEPLNLDKELQEYGV